jgi:phage tail-like protein
MPAAPTPDSYGKTNWFKVTLDGDPLKEESHFREVTGLDVYIDTVEIQEGGKNDGAHTRPGSTRYSHIVLKRGVSQSKAFFNWVAAAVNRDVKRMGGKIALCQPDGTSVIEWTFEKGWPCRYEGPRLDAEHNAVAFESIEIAHEGLKMQPGGK